jgi:hypothetical protein
MRIALKKGWFRRAQPRSGGRGRSRLSAVGCDCCGVANAEPLAPSCIAPAFRGGGIDRGTPSTLPQLGPVVAGHRACGPASRPRFSSAGARSAVAATTKRYLPGDGQRAQCAALPGHETAARSQLKKAPGWPQATSLRVAHGSPHRSVQSLLLGVRFRFARGKAVWRRRSGGLCLTTPSYGEPGGMVPPCSFVDLLI